MTKQRSINAMMTIQPLLEGDDPSVSAWRARAWAAMIALVALVFASPLVGAETQDTSDDWRQFRGSRFNSTPMTGLPTTWSATENIAWKSDLPGPGTSSPIVVDNRIFVTCFTMVGSDNQTSANGGVVRHLVCLDRRDGKRIWAKAMSATRSPQPFESVIQKHGYASHSPTSDGKHVFVHYGNSGVHAFDFNGNIVWKADIGEAVGRYGSGASLVTHNGLLLVNASIESQSLIALDLTTGKERWRTKLRHSFSTPIVFNDNSGRDIACVTDYDRGFVGVDLKTGREVWRWTGFYEPGYGCSSPVLVNGVIYGTASNEGPVAAFRPQGSGDITNKADIWRDTTRYRPRVTSPVVHDGKLFWIENSIGVVYDTTTGKRLEGKRLPWKGCYATPLLAEGRLFITTNFEGTYVVTADEQMKVIAHNVIESDRADQVQFNASPVPHRGQLLLRSNKALYCIGKK